MGNTISDCQYNNRLNDDKLALLRQIKSLKKIIVQDGNTIDKLNKEIYELKNKNTDDWIILQSQKN